MSKLNTVPNDSLSSRLHIKKRQYQFTYTVTRHVVIRYNHNPVVDDNVIYKKIVATHKQHYARSTLNTAPRSSDLIIGAYVSTPQSSSTSAATKSHSHITINKLQSTNDSSTKKVVTSKSTTNTTETVSAQAITPHNNTGAKLDADKLLIRASNILHRYCNTRDINDIDVVNSLRSNKHNSDHIDDQLHHISTLLSRLYKLQYERLSSDAASTSEIDLYNTCKHAFNELAKTLPPEYLMPKIVFKQRAALIDYS